MRHRAPFFQTDLEQLDRCFHAKASKVIAIEDVIDGARTPDVLGLRHDCDDYWSLFTAVDMARWEAERGYRSSYYLLHTAHYWNDPDFEELVAEIASYGHEIGLHLNALAESFRTGEDPDLILDRALDRLRGLGHRVRGVAGHGDRLCNYSAGPDEPWFANDEQFSECARTHVGGMPVDGPGRMLWRGNIRRKLTSRPLADFGLEYEALFAGLPFHFRFSDSGGRWSTPGWNQMVRIFDRSVQATTAPDSPDEPRQLHLLIHPDWWRHAFPRVRQAA